MIDLKVLRELIRLIENVVLGLAGFVAAWAVVVYSPGLVVLALAATGMLALAGRLLFDGIMWTAGVGIIAATFITGTVRFAEMFNTIGS